MTKKTNLEDFSKLKWGASEYGISAKVGVYRMTISIAPPPRYPENPSLPFKWSICKWFDELEKGEASTYKEAYKALEASYYVMLPLHANEPMKVQSPKLS